MILSEFNKPSILSELNEANMSTSTNILSGYQEILLALNDSNNIHHHHHHTPEFILNVKDIINWSNLAENLNTLKEWHTEWSYDITIIADTISNSISMEIPLHIEKNDDINNSNNNNIDLVCNKLQYYSDTISNTINILCENLNLCLFRHNNQILNSNTIPTADTMHHTVSLKQQKTINDLLQPRITPIAIINIFIEYNIIGYILFALSVTERLCNNICDLVGYNNQLAFHLSLHAIHCRKAYIYLMTSILNLGSDGIFVLLAHPEPLAMMWNLSVNYDKNILYYSSCYDWKDIVSIQGEEVYEEEEEYSKYDSDAPYASLAISLRTAMSAMIAAEAAFDNSKSQPELLALAKLEVLSGFSAGKSVVAHILGTYFFSSLLSSLENSLKLVEGGNKSGQGLSESSATRVCVRLVAMILKYANSIALMQIMRELPRLVKICKFLSDASGMHASTRKLLKEILVTVKTYDSNSSKRKELDSNHITLVEGSLDWIWAVWNDIISDSSARTKNNVHSRKPAIEISKGGTCNPLDMNINLSTSIPTVPLKAKSDMMRLGFVLRCCLSQYDLMIRGRYSGGRDDELELQFSNIEILANKALKTAASLRLLVWSYVFGIKPEPTTTSTTTTTTTTTNTINTKPNIDVAITDQAMPSSNESSTPSNSKNDTSREYKPEDGTQALLLDCLSSSILLLKFCLNSILSLEEKLVNFSELCRSKDLVIEVIYIHAAFVHLLRWKLGGDANVYARRTVGICCDILQLYCPPSPWSKNCLFIPILSTISFDNPIVMLSSIPLLLGILRESLTDTSIYKYARGNSCIITNNTFNDSTNGIRKEQSVIQLFIQWEDFLLRQIKYDKNYNITLFTYDKKKKNKNENRKSQVFNEVEI